MLALGRTLVALGAGQVAGGVVGAAGQVGEKDRSTLYLMSCAVTGVPSSYLTPCLRWKVQVLAPLEEVPRSVARSGTSSPPAVPGAAL